MASSSLTKTIHLKYISSVQSRLVKLENLLSKIQGLLVNKPGKEGIGPFNALILMFNMLLNLMKKANKSESKWQ